jgi:FAD/FMN-containing dehydrogenase
MTQHIMFRNGGAISRVKKGSTAATHRDPPYMYHPIACWDDPVRDDEHIEWVRRASDALKPFATGGVYLNFTGEEVTGKVQTGFDADVWERLVALKDQYDPNNMFRFNQNIPPSGA